MITNTDLNHRPPDGADSDTLYCRRLILLTKANEEVGRVQIEVSKLIHIRKLICSNLLMQKDQLATNNANIETV